MDSSLEVRVLSIVLIVAHTELQDNWAPLHQEEHLPELGAIPFL